MKKRLFLILFALLPLAFSPPALSAQDGEPMVVQLTDPSAQEKEERELAELPRRFRQLSLGMSLEDLKESLVKDDYFNFRGDRDVSFLPSREQSLVETIGSSFIKRAFFQLRDGAVFIMAFSLNPLIVDHYSVFMQFTEKYGEPSYLDPQMSIWETEETRIAIERPLTVKYIDKTVFNDIVNESGLIQSGQVKLRQDFLNEF